MVNPQIKTCKQLFKKGTKVTKKHSKNAKRRIRRKRNKFKYYQYLRKQRTVKKTEELCEAVGVFDLMDMEWSSGVEAMPSVELPTEIIEWQKRDQIAYWKSKALSLELENRMLRQHLRDVYAKTVEEYASYNAMNQECLQDTIEHSVQENGGQAETCNKNDIKQKQSNKIKKIEVIAPNFPEHKSRSDELKKLYGENSPKILGMETALQLNYERHLEKSKASYWPNIPLNY